MITIENRFLPIRSAACFLVDGVLILFSVIGSFLLLEKTGYIVFMNLGDAIIRGITIVIFCQICLYLLDLYDLKISHSFGELFFSFVFAVGFFCIGIGIITFIFPVFGLESRIYYLTIVLILILLMAWRIAFYYYILRFSPPHNILILGGGRAARMVADEINQRKGLGFRLVGWVAPNYSSNNQFEQNNIIFGQYDSINEIVSENNVNEVVVAIEERRGEYPVKEMLSLRVKGYKILEWQPFFEKLSGRIPIDNLPPSFFIFNDGFSKSVPVQIMRRAMNFLIALSGIVLLSPFFIVIPIMIRLDSSGPIFYFQRREGLNGKIFNLIKFRSMLDDSEVETGPRWASENDPRITRVGKWIRNFRIDEFPQMINVLKGDMDIVGPRPERPEFVRTLQETIPYYSLRHTVRPGITGWAQVMFPYCGTIEESKEKLQYDLFYIKNMSLTLDLLIIVRTMKIMILGRGSR